jgi:hypothetical protein
MTIVQPLTLFLANQPLPIVLFTKKSNPSSNKYYFYHLFQCKESISNYIHFNQFGARFNLFALLAQMNNIETSAFTHLSDASKVSNKKLENHQNHKITY